MASPSSFSQFFLLFCLLLMIINPSRSSLELKNADARHPHVVQANRVNLSLYYETLCPVGEDFIVNDLVDLFNSDALSIVNLHLVPYGNARITYFPYNTVICQLNLRNGRETDRLKPPHEFVPWVTVDGKPLRYDYKNYLEYVCDAYKGHPKPKACKIGTTSTEKTNSTHPVCIASDVHQVYP